MTAASPTSPRAARVIDGRAHADAVLAEVTAAVAAHVAQGHRAPRLATVLVGVDPASRVYIGAKHRACARTGIESVHYDLPFETTQGELETLVDALNVDDSIDGILIQLPLPPHCQADPLLDRLRADKDVDGFHPTNIGLLAQKRPGLRPCTPWGVMEMLKREGINPAGMDAVVVGASNIVGRPMALELLLARATVTVCHSATKDLQGIIERADLVVAAVGKAGFVPGAWIKPGAVVIDVGINRGADGKLNGDVEYGPAAARASAITPVPGGVGPMTVAMLMKNTLTAARHAAVPKALRA